MERDMDRWIRDMMGTGPKRPMPVLSFPGIRLLGIGVRQLVSDGSLQGKCMVAIAERFRSAAALSCMDLSVEAEAFGAQVAFSDSEVPSVTGTLIHGAEEARALRSPELGAGRTGEYLEAVRIAASSIGDRPTIAGIIGPFSLAGRLMDMTEIMTACLMDPEAVHAVLEKATDFAIRYAKAFKAKGANGLLIAEPAAGLLSPPMCLEFSSLYVKRIIEAVEDGEFAVIYHNCGKVIPLAEAVLATGARVIHLGNAINLEDAFRVFPEDRLIMGNLDPAGVFRNGSPESVARATTELMKAHAGRKNWVISSGCDIPPSTAFENIDAFFTAVGEFG